MLFEISNQVIAMRVLSLKKMDELFLFVQNLSNVLKYSFVSRICTL